MNASVLPACRYATAQDNSGSVAFTALQRAGSRRALGARAGAPSVPALSVVVGEISSISGPTPTRCTVCPDGPW